jgi:two-component system, cell cycle response regulator DivK
VSKLILIVDDSADARFVLGAILNYDGYRVVEAVNGKEAVEKACRHRPDLILMDIQMPVMDGMTAARLIRAEPSLERTIIIAVTGEDLSRDEFTDSIQVFNNCFPKPITPAAEVQRMIGPPTR